MKYSARKLSMRQKGGGKLDVMPLWGGLHEPLKLIQNSPLPPHDNNQMFAINPEERFFDQSASCVPQNVFSDTSIGQTEQDTDENGDEAK